MAEDTILITVRDRDPLVVSKQRLVESSSVFSYIIVDCSQPEHDITDFSPEIVEIFLTLLEDKKVDQIEESDFRQLHKISVVFDVQWLIDSCREWLLEKINNVGEVIDYESLLFLFDECYYIHSKWNLTQYMETLILEVRFKDNSLFLSPYIRENYDQLSTDQLKFLLYLAGSNTKVFLELIIERINSQEYLDDRTRYLLQHMRLSLCVQQSEHQLYHEMSVRLAEMSDMSNDDLRLILKLTAEATIEASDRNNNISSTTTVYDGKRLFDSLVAGDCNCLADITRSITEDKINSMYEVIDLLANVAYENTLSTEEIEKFVESLENLSPNKPLQIASTQYVDTLITALEFSDSDSKHQFINLLTKIRNSEKLSSCYDNIRLVGEKITQSTVVNSLKNFLGLRNPLPNRFVFRMKHPGTTDCKRKGDCGFIIKQSERGSYEWSDLSKEAADYTDSGVHVHDAIRAEHMHWYEIITGTTTEGNTVRLPGMWWWRRWWFSGEVTSWKITEYCVDYNIRDHLVAKY